MKAVDDEADRSKKVDLMLGWASLAMGFEGAAYIDLRQGMDKPIVTCASGTLARLFDSEAIRVEDGSRAFSGSSVISFCLGDRGVSERGYFHPVWVEEGCTLGGLLLHGASPPGREPVEPAHVELAFVSSILRGLMEKARLLEQLEREKAFVSLLVDRRIKADGKAVNPGFDLITDGLGLPLYMSDLSGNMIYASPAFLKLVGYASVNEIRQRKDFFLEPQSRIAELNLLRAQGKVSSYTIGVRSGNHLRLEIQDSAVTVGAFIFGVFFDVTGFFSVNKELKDSLEIQEQLNDRIISATQTLQRTHVTSIRALARLAEYRDKETGFHLQRICEYTRIIAQKVLENKPYVFKLNSSYPNDISLSSMLHDIGKVSIPDSILLKPDKLDREEWEIMKRHTVYGWDILNRADKELGEQSFLTLASTIALSHHERYDGTGYPSGLDGERIPLSARISAVADVYDALTTKRPYKQPWSHERAVEEINGLSGRQFDPILVEIFTQVGAEFSGIRRVFPG
jgi:HD-GYP domain-containing protein (c-di-GMP phosphodiesterase class II)